MELFSMPMNYILCIENTSGVRHVGVQTNFRCLLAFSRFSPTLSLDLLFFQRVFFSVGPLDVRCFHFVEKPKYTIQFQLNRYQHYVYLIRKGRV